MTQRTFLLVLGVASILANAARADAPIPAEAFSSPAPVTSAVFRNELTDVTVKEVAPSTFDDLYNSGTRSGSYVYFRQKLGDQFVIEQSATIGRQVSEVSAPLGAYSSGESTSTYNVTSARWNPVAPLTLSFSNTSDQNFSPESPDSLLTDSRRIEADWQAAPRTKLSLADQNDRDFDYGSSAYDLYHNTGLTFSQMLGKSNVTWNVTPSWEEETTGGDFPSAQAGPQLNTSFDWKPAEGTKWTVGGGWNEMNAVANAVEQSTHALFVSYDRAVSQRLKFLVRTDYQNQISPRSSSSPADEQKQLSVQMGQKYAVSETLSAQLDVRHSFQQENRESWATAESMATFSLKKSF